MTKTLTEQWREGKLPKGYYYIIANTEQKHRVVFYLPERDMEDEARIDLKDQFVLEVLAPVPSYDHFSQLVKKVERLQEQLKEAREVVKFYAETTVGHKQKDGTYGMWVCSGEMAWENPLDRIKSRMDYICYDPRPAKKWLKKWGVK